MGGGVWGLVGVCGVVGQQSPKDGGIKFLNEKKNLFLLNKF